MDERRDGNTKKIRRAAVRAAQGVGPPPTILVLAWRVQEYGMTAVFGNQGVAWGTLTRMTAMKNIFNVVKGAQGGDQKAAKASKEELELLAGLRKEGLL